MNNNNVMSLFIDFLSFFLSLWLLSHVCRSTFPTRKFIIFCLRKKKILLCIPIDYVSQICRTWLRFYKTNKVGGWKVGGFRKTRTATHAQIRVSRTYKHTHNAYLYAQSQCNNRRNKSLPSITLQKEYIHRYDKSQEKPVCKGNGQWLHWHLQDHMKPLDP